MTLTEASHPKGFTVPGITLRVNERTNERYISESNAPDNRLNVYYNNKIKQSFRVISDDIVEKNVVHNYNDKQTANVYTVYVEDWFITFQFRYRRVLMRHSRRL
jgi:hypothetical protein